MTSNPFRLRRPHPWDIELDVGNGFVGLMCVPGQDGLMVARRTNPMGQVSPTTFEYGSYPPDVESTFVFGRLTGGMGEHVQSSATSKRYRYADRVDCSIGGMPRLGPLFADAVFPAVLGDDPTVRQFIVGPGEEGLIGTPTPRALYCLRGRGVYRLEAGTWVLSKDFLGVDAPLRAVVFQGTAGPARLLVSTKLGALWGYDGTNPWQIWGAAAGEDAWFCAVVGDECYIAAANDVRRATADPLAAGSFSGAIRVGHAATRITDLCAVADTLFIFKADGVYTLNADGSDNDLFPELRPQATGPGGFVPEFVPVGYPVNGLNAVAWRDAIYFPYGEAYYRVSAGGTLEPIGPERLVENVGPVRGRAVSGSGHADWFLYLGIYDPAQNASHLLKYGTWRPDPTAEAPAAYRFDDVWNGALASWPGKQVTRLDVIHLDGEATLWVGFVDGSVVSTALPARTPDPVLDPRCRFVDTGTVYAPLHDAVFGADQKCFHAFTCLAPLLNASLTAQVVYRVDPPNYFPDDVPPYQRLNPQFFQSGQRWSLPDITDGVPRDSSAGFRLDFGVELRTADPASSPVLEGVALHEAIRPWLHLVWSFTVKAGNRVVRRDGVVSTRSAEAILLLLRQAAAAPGLVRMRTPTEVVGAFAYLDYREQLAPDRGRDGLDWDISVTAGSFG